MVQSMSRPDLTPVSYVVLGLVARDGPSTPYALKTAVGRGIAHFWQFPHSQIYAETERLARLGLLAEEREQTGRRRRSYRITAAGRAALAAWLAEPTDEAPPGPQPRPAQAVLRPARRAGGRGRAGQGPGRAPPRLGRGHHRDRGAAPGPRRPTGPAGRGRAHGRRLPGHGRALGAGRARIRRADSSRRSRSGPVKRTASIPSSRAAATLASESSTNTV